ncbi:hypothetical protein [Brucella pseudogrignonensis]|uniref:Uncharacterized protein n=1 Tax=Brucella pseudogrignonensis TaxID=419475 RepID=A0ABU1M5H7_9HYPH|nr:hypothetical protein [Brucella pseudogrignonensis]MDR6431276.1 hypothetical protein [Brucella pseudogrignonensis]
MKLKAFSIVAISLLAVTPAQSKSLMIFSPRHIATDILAWATPIQVHCGREFFMRHTTFDLVWDVYQLKAGAPINQNEADLDAYNQAAEQINDDFGKTWDCREAYKKFGEGGTILRGVMYPANLDKTLSNPF